MAHWCAEGPASGSLGRLCCSAPTKPLQDKIEHFDPQIPPQDRNYKHTDVVVCHDAVHLWQEAKDVCPAQYDSRRYTHDQAAVDRSTRGEKQHQSSEQTARQANSNYDG